MKQREEEAFRSKYKATNSSTLILETAQVNAGDGTISFRTWEGRPYGRATFPLAEAESFIDSLENLLSGQEVDISSECNSDAEIAMIETFSTYEDPQGLCGLMVSFQTDRIQGKARKIQFKYDDRWKVYNTIERAVRIGKNILKGSV
jgi:hypothetical protein